MKRAKHEKAASAIFWLSSRAFFGVVGPHPPSTSSGQAKPLSEGEGARQSCVKQQGRWFTGRAKRWPGWTSNPFLAVPRSAGRGADGQRSRPASCSDPLPLFERRERSECSEFGSAAPRPSIAGCPQGHGQWGRLFFGYFLLAEQKKVTAPPGAQPGRRRLQSSTASQAKKPKPPRRPLPPSESAPPAPPT